VHLNIFDQASGAPQPRKDSPWPPQPSTHTPIVPPACAEGLSDWAVDNEFRFVISESGVDGTNLVLSPVAAQIPDGSIDTEATVTTDRPHVTIYEFADGDTHERLRVNLKDARKLAQLPLDATDELDRCATT
jgi:hypothetical protein